MANGAALAEADVVDEARVQFLGTDWTLRVKGRHILSPMRPSVRCQLSLTLKIEIPFPHTIFSREPVKCYVYRRLLLIIIWRSPE